MLDFFFFSLSLFVCDELDCSFAFCELALVGLGWYSSLHAVVNKQKKAGLLAK